MVSGFPRQTNLGFFGPFMQAWGAAPAPNRLRLYWDALSYEAGNETAADLYRQTSEELGVPIPSSALNA